jgi:hypothetical protein
MVSFIKIEMDLNTNWESLTTKRQYKQQEQWPALRPYLPTNTCSPYARV